MNDDRRERYAAAIEGVSLWRAADAAMAVADAEIRQLHIGIEAGYQGSVKALAEDNARLRAELDDALADLSTEQRRKEDALATIQRVRALAADMRTCSHRGTATHYAQSIDDALDRPEAGQ